MVRFGGRSEGRRFFEIQLPGASFEYFFLHLCCEPVSHGFQKLISLSNIQSTTNMLDIKIIKVYKNALSRHGTIL